MFNDISRTVMVAALALCAVQLRADAPELTFGSSEVTFANVAAGTRVAWISVTRIPEDHHSLVTVERGVEVGQGRQKAKVSRADADTTRSLWLVAAIDEDVAGAAVSPAYVASATPIEVTAISGASTISVISPEVELLYVRPNVGAWCTSARDGARNDQDEERNAVIVVDLQSLTALGGDEELPETIEEGDTILILDPRASRTTVVQVSE